MNAWVKSRRRAASNGERGSVLVEFGLVVPIFVTLVIGAATLGLSYNANNSLNNAARESARYGATLAVEGDMSAWLSQVADAAVLAAGGELGNEVPSRQICVAYVHPAGTATTDQTVAMVRSGAGDTLATGKTCFGDGRPDNERRVQVAVSRESTIQAVVYGSIFEVEAKSVVVYERAGDAAS